MISSDTGRIGPFYWFNSDTTFKPYVIPIDLGFGDTGMVQTVKAVRWGTFGIGRHVRMNLEAVE
jgi:hypothetical protein